MPWHIFVCRTNGFNALAYLVLHFLFFLSSCISCIFAFIVFLVFLSVLSLHFSSRMLGICFVYRIQVRMPWHLFCCISCFLVFPVGYAKAPFHGDTGIQDTQTIVLVQIISSCGQFINFVDLRKFRRVESQNRPGTEK